MDKYEPWHEMFAVFGLIAIAGILIVAESYILTFFFGVMSDGRGTTAGIVIKRTISIWSILSSAAIIYFTVVAYRIKPRAMRFLILITAYAIFGIIVNAILCLFYRVF